MVGETDVPDIVRAATAELVVTDLAVSRWNVHDERRRDLWGNPVVPRWYEEASAVPDLDGNVQPLRPRRSDEQRITVGADGLGVDR